MIELTVQQLPKYPEVALTGELGITRTDDRWERNGQQLIGPISKLILQHQPHEASWISAAISVTGWPMERIFAFQLRLSRVPVTIKGSYFDIQKGLTDATIYSLLWKMARAKHRPVV